MTVRLTAIAVGLLLTLFATPPVAAAEDGFTIIETQSFETELDGFGEVRFVALTDNLQCRFEIWQNGTRVYVFPDAHSSNWTCREVEAVAIGDLNGDGLKDVVIISTALTGIGPTGAMPFQSNTVYYSTGAGQFVAKAEVNEFASEHTSVGALQEALSGSTFAVIDPAD